MGRRRRRRRRRRNEERKNQKSQALEPKTTQKFKRAEEAIQNCSDLKTENPYLDIVLSLEHTGGLKPEDFVGTLAVSSISPFPPTLSHLSIVPYERPITSSSRVSRWKNKNQTLSNYWNRKKLATLSNHFKPIPFVREKTENIADFQSLLTRLGLWSLLHLDFDQNIRIDLLKQLISFYSPKKPVHRRTHVNGYPIMLTRAAMGHALALPTKRLKFSGNDASGTDLFMGSEESSLFLDELVCSWLVLQDGDHELPGEVMKVRNLIRERRPDEVDWAGLVWIMVRNEIMKRDKLVNCYYASHLQLLLKNQRPQLFQDHAWDMGLLFLDSGAAVSNEEPMGKRLCHLEEPEMVNRGTGLFNEDSEKERSLDVEESAREQTMETNFKKCCKSTNSSLKVGTEGSTFDGEKLQDPQTIVTPSVGNATHEVQYNNAVELRLLCDKIEESDNQQGVSDYMEAENGENHASSSANDMLAKEDIDEDGMHILNKQETVIEQRDLVLNPEEGEMSLGLSVLAVDQKVIDGEICFPDQESAILKEELNGELRLLHDEDENNLSEAVLKEDSFGNISGESHDSLGKRNVHLTIGLGCNKMECHQGELTDREYSSGGDMLINEECNDEGLKIKCSSGFTMSEMHILNRLEHELEQMDLVSSQEKGEKEFSLDASVQDCKIISENACILDEQYAVKMKDGNGGLRLLSSENENKPSKVFLESEIHSETEDGRGEMKLLHGEDERKLSEGLVKEEIYDRRAHELLDSQEKEDDYECKQMDYHQTQLNCSQEDKYGEVLESGSANDILMDEDSNEERRKVECSSDLRMCAVHTLSRQETDSQQMDLVLRQDKDEQCATERENENRESRLLDELSGGLVGDKLLVRIASESIDSREKKVGDGLISTEHHIKMEEDYRESTLVHGNYESEFSEGLVTEEPGHAKTGKLRDNQNEVEFSAEMSCRDSENRKSAEMAMEEEKPEVQGIHDSLTEGEEIVKPEASVLNESIGAEMDLQNKNAIKTELFAEPFASERGIYMNLADSCTDTWLKSEIDRLNDSQFECLNETHKFRGVNSAAYESFDIDSCFEQMELWMSRLKCATYQRAQLDNDVNGVLLKELEEKKRIIEQYEKTRLQEHYMHLKDMHRYGREIYLTRCVLDEYRTALNEVQKSFDQYRQRVQLPEEPLYVDHPDGGGKVVLASELDNSALKQ